MNFYKKSTQVVIVLVVMGALSFLGLLGCAKLQPAVTPSQMADEPTPKNVLSPGDEIEIKFPFNPEYNETQTISSDGTIAVQLLGDVKAAGKSRGELRNELVKLYTPYLKSPELTVIPRKQYHRRVYVGGQVLKPGLVDMPGQMTALSAIMFAGGFDAVTASPKVLVIRQRDGEAYACALDFKPGLEGARQTSFFLEPEDIVFVPRSGINRANQWIDQYINKMVPQFGATAFYPMGPGALGRLGIDTSASRIAPR